MIFKGVPTMKRTMNTIACIGLIAGLGTCANAYTNTTLDLVIKNHMTLLSGDKAFSNFTFLSTDFLASQVTVQYGDDVVDKDGNFGIRFQEGFLARSTAVDFGLVFNVTATASDKLISDAHLGIAGTARGNGSSATVSETVIPNLGNALGLDAFVAVDANGKKTFQYTDSAFLDIPSKSVMVLKDVLLDPGTASDGFASISLISQYFSQTGTVPEPGSVAVMIGMGVSGTLLFMKRRKK